jgi:hypothetical protein
MTYVSSPIKLRPTCEWQAFLLCRVGEWTYAPTHYLLMFHSSLLRCQNDTRDSVTNAHSMTRATSRASHDQCNAAPIYSNIRVPPRSFPGIPPFSAMAEQRHNYVTIRPWTTAGYQYAPTSACQKPGLLCQSQGYSVKSQGYCTIDFYSLEEGTSAHLYSVREEYDERIEAVLCNGPIGWVPEEAEHRKKHKRCYTS